MKQFSIWIAFENSEKPFERKNSQTGVSKYSENQVIRLSTTPFHD